MSQHLQQQAYVTIRSRRPADANDGVDQGSVPEQEGIGARRQRRYSQSAMAPEAPGPIALPPKPATHDTSRVNFHVKNLGHFAETLEESASRAFPNRGRTSQRYKQVQALLLHWGSDDLFVLPELEDLERCLREDFAFDTDIFSIPSENSHLELMMRVGSLIKDHESQDTLFLVYYGGHARIDESRQSTWCATRNPDSPWLQWSAIQTLLERSASDVLILLDCCAGAASATFPTGSSITETISASSWDAIAPDPGRYSFTNALIEVMQEWRLRTFSAAMLHAEVLARLKHPRPITINGKLFEARSTPVHFMMTSNHRAPSIELTRVVPLEKRPPSPPQDRSPGTASTEATSEAETATGRGPALSVPTEPNEDTPHVMISLALEGDQQLDLNAWEQWLAAFPAMAKYVKVQGVFKSHSTLLLLSMPVMVWDLLPEDHATSFIAFIRSNNMLPQLVQPPPVRVPVHDRQRHAERTQPDTVSFFSDTTCTPTERESIIGGASARPIRATLDTSSSSSRAVVPTPHRSSPSSSAAVNVRSMISNQQRSERTTVFTDYPEPPKFSQHVEARLEQYFQTETFPNDDQKSFVASNLGIEPWHVEAWFHHRRGRDILSRQFRTIKMADIPPPEHPQAKSILAGHLNMLLEVLPPKKLLIVDLRSPADYEKTHIYNAVNLRAPRSFLREASFDMIERSFADKQSRRKFATWQSTACLVVYARAIDHLSDCPTADLLFERFRGWGWGGRCFVLKGHFREFSVSYSKFIAGTKMTQEAKDHIASLETQQPTSPSGQGTAAPAPAPTGAEEMADRENQYGALLAQIDRESGGHSPGPPAVSSADRESALAQQEEDLEQEFQQRLPDLYRKAMDVAGAEQSGAPPAFRGDWALSSGGSSSAKPTGKAGDDDKFDIKAPMVEYLDRGLAKIRHEQQHAATGSLPTGPAEEGIPAKLAAEGYFDSYTGEFTASDDSYVKIGTADTDPGVTAAAAVTSDAAKGRAPAAASPGDELPRKGRGGGFLSKVLRRT
ncbi:hypothetical protein F5X68DRAFT_273413 [Plectosphaerella plurivora]|uniref:Tyrosine-protein phosphatase non-receptor type 6 n=1 Tax=Plectosphaerella plurivora TaxID=936078 RepID=A0A9P8VJ07_9PEZI|nr:hypothetical protein F5X68DRAFT_273413 [Plectosphaerella plurivora]